MGISPTQIAMLLLKLNVYLFLITIGISGLSFFPYYMHLNQISNNVAMDVANRNYIETGDVSKFVGHLNAAPGQKDSTTYSLLTFRESDIKGRVVSGTDNKSSSEYAKAGGVTAFSTKVSADKDSYALSSGGNTTVAIGVKALSGSKANKSLLVKYTGGKFDPVNNNTALVDGMTGNKMSNNSILVNRGTPFKVKLQTRYKVSAGTLGFMFHAAIPVELETIGVTTQYYQYDSE